MYKPLVLATTIAALLASEHARSADLYWDGTGTSWNSVGSWSQAIGAPTPNPAAVPGVNDKVILHANGVTGAQTINLDGPQSALALETNSTNAFLTTIQGGGTNQILSLGTGGINHVAGGFDIGSATDGQKVEISLLGSQTWTSSAAGTNPRAIFVLNGVSLANSGNQTLTLTGINTGSKVDGVISDGAGILNLTKTNGTGRWTLGGLNTYTGVTTLTGGILAVGTIGDGGQASNLGAASNAASNLVFDGGTLLYSGTSTITDRGFTINAGKIATFNVEQASTTIAVSGNSTVTTGGLSKAGQGTLEFTQGHAYSGATTISQGRLILSGSGALANSAISIGQSGNGTSIGTTANSGILTISSGGGSVVRGGSLIANGGVLGAQNGLRTLQVNGSMLGNSHDTFGALDIRSGSFWGNVSPDFLSNARLTFSGLTRATATQLHFGDGLANIGTETIASTTAGVANVDFTTAPTALMIGGALGTPAAGVLPFASVNGVIATYDPARGLRALDTATEMSDIASAATGDNAKVATAGTATLNANLTVNSVWGSHGTVALAGKTLTVTSGAIAANGNYTIGASADDGTVNFGSTEGNVMVGPNSVLRINSVIDGANGLTVGLTNYGTNTATLVLGGANTFSGTTTITGNNTNLRLTVANELALQHSILDYSNTGAGVRFGANDAANGVVVDVTSATIGGLKGNQSLALTNSGPAGGGVALTVGSPLNSEATTYSGVLSGPGSLIKDGTGRLTLSGGSANTYTGDTIVKQGIVVLNKTSGSTGFISIPGNLTIESGGRLQLITGAHNQIANAANVVMSGAGSIFNGSGINVDAANVTDTFASITVTGGAMMAGQDLTGFIVTGAASFTGGTGNTIYVGNSGSRFTVGSLLLKDMTATAGATVSTANSFTIYGNHPTARSRVTVGSGGLTLENSVLNLRQGGSGAQGSQLILNGNVTTTGSLPSRISRDANGGATGQISVDLSSTTGTHNRTFTIAGGGADLGIDVPVVNGSATSGAITKEGLGTMTLTAANTYNGGTTINAGTLLANNTAGSATGTGPVAVSINGTLGGTGTITGAVTVASGGTLLGGTGLTATDDLALSGGVSLTGNSVIKLALGPTGAHSSLIATGGLWSFAPSQAFSFIDLGATTSFYDNIIVGLGSAPANIGSWTITTAGFVGTFTFDGSNVDLNLTAVPEPGSAALLLGGVGLLGGFRRLGRRRK